VTRKEEPIHPLERIIKAHTADDAISTGSLVTIDIDVAGVNDLYLQVLESFREMGGRFVWDPEKVFFFDHYSPPSTIHAASNQHRMREFAREQGIRNLFDIDAGVCHQVLFDHRVPRPGRTIVLTDSHTTTHGAYGTFSTGVGATDMASILLSGKLWIRVPEVIEIEVVGNLPENAMAKDIILYILGQVGSDGAVYKAIEYSGSAVYSLPLDQRAVLTNMSVEMGAKATYIAPDLAIRDYFGPAETTDSGMRNDPRQDRRSPLRFDVSELAPQAALPGSVDQVVDVAGMPG
jgi:homoaconitase/3-isopropylmalate dehydratase large subunit